MHPSRAESPSSVGPFLVWQQPHPIYYAEALRIASAADRATLERFREVVQETAEFMASFAAWDEVAQRFGPAAPGRAGDLPEADDGQRHVRARVLALGARAAQRWRERLGLAREERFDRVLRGLALPVRDGRYLFAETAPASYDEPRWARDHPSVHGCSRPPGPGVETMRRSFDWIWTHGSFPDTGAGTTRCWRCAPRGWGEPARAVDALLMDAPKNVYRPNGHNHQRPGLTMTRRATLACWRPSR